MVDHLKHEGTLHSSSDLLKIFVKMRSSWSAQVLRQAGDTLSGPGAFLLLFSLKTWRMSSSLIFSVGVVERGLLEVLMVVWRDVQTGQGCFSKPTVKVIQIVCQLLILHSAGGWCLVTGDVFHSLPH